MTTYNAPKKKTNNGAPAVEWTEEQRAEFDLKWLAYAKMMGRLDFKEEREFDGVIIDITEPYEKEVTYEGITTKKTVRTIKVELRGNKPVRVVGPRGEAQVSVDGLRFTGDSADNPFNDKTLLHKACRAIARVTPDEDKPFTIEWPSLYEQPTRVVIQKGGERRDGKRGGFHSNLKGFKRPLVDDDEDEAPVPTPKAGGGVRPPAPPARTTASAPSADDDDEVPF